MVIASIPDVWQCVATLKDDFRIAADYSPETGKFVVEGSFEQVSCVQTRLQTILEHQLEEQKRRLRRLSSRGQHHPGQFDAGATARLSPVGQPRPITYDWTAGSNVDPQHQAAAAAAASSDYRRFPSHGGKQNSTSSFPRQAGSIHHKVCGFRA